MAGTTVTMKMEIIAAETVRPSSRTPPRLQNLKLSLLDQNAPPVYFAFILFYAAEPDYIDVAGRSNRLKESLSETLTRFYPVAGRIKDHRSVDCNDEGVRYLEARVSCRVRDVLSNPEHETVKRLIPEEPTSELGGAPLLLVQANFFAGGGMALGVLTWHKIADGTSLCAFINAWASTALGFPDTAVPNFTAASSRFPPRDQPPATLSEVVKFKQPEEKFTVKRFVFEASKIAALKAKAAGTRVQSVTALLWKCALTAARSRRRKPLPRPSALIGAVNIRPRLVPPLSQYSFGNVLGLLLALADAEETNQLRSLVRCLSKGIEESTCGDRAMKLEMLQKVKNGDGDTYVYGCWCGLPVYGAGDFGWGKPSWAQVGVFTAANAIVLMDTRDGDAIEARVSLVPQEMALFECDPELLAFACAKPNPTC
ncbi:vinorine synthase-like [Diospyros lotus]|uniref:vinorine synthase-like n=1 Tax=Diospyros lotus TaxID=55363 RepID=UPI002257CBC2|nr:vinorine synthase-like [Diospyros lotus]